MKSSSSSTRQPGTCSTIPLSALGTGIILPAPICSGAVCRRGLGLVVPPSCGDGEAHSSSPKVRQLFIHLSLLLMCSS
jgi:hypothetical protein